MLMRSPRPHFDLTDPQFSSHSNKLAFLGRALKKSGRVATVILAGGEGSRLGLGPKALIKGNFSEAEEVSLIEHLLTEAIGPVVVFVSPHHRSAIESHIQDFLDRNENSAEVRLVEQKMWPYLDAAGAEAFGRDQKPIEGPRGNGEVFERLKAEGFLDVFKKEGIEYVQILPIDNPKSPQFADALIGAAIKAKSDVTYAAFDKGERENVGLLLEDAKTIKVREYVSLNQNETQALTLANAGIYVLSLEACGRASEKELKRYKVLKSKEIDGSMHSLIKQETFIFEAFEDEVSVSVVKICIKNHYQAIKTSEDLAAFS